MLEINNELVSSFDGLNELIVVYHELDSLIMNLKSTAKFDCIQHCSKCCNTAAKNIEVSVFEVLPLSIYMWQKGEADYWLQKIDQSHSDSPCVLFHGETSLELGGGCTIYTWRPLMCRLFGFSAVQNKHGKLLISLCKYMKKKDHNLENRIQEMIDHGLNIPVNSCYAQKISLINPFLGQERYPINQALKLALEKVGYRMALLNNIQNNPSDDTPPKHPPFGKTA